MANENIGEGTGQQPGGSETNSNQNQNAAPGDKGVGTEQNRQQQQQEKVFTFKEDRTDWVPRHRINEYGQRLTAAEQRAKDFEQQLEQERKRVRALSGVETPNPKEAEFNELKSLLTQMFPFMKNFENVTPEQMEELMEAARTARGATAASWERHALGMFDELEAQLAERLDTDKLTPSQSRTIRRAYQSAAQDALSERQRAMDAGLRPTIETLPSDRDFVARHEQGDRSLIAEVVKAHLDDWFEPARRSVTTAQARRNMRPVPSGGRKREMLVQGQKKFDLSTEDGFKAALAEARQVSTE